MVQKQREAAMVEQPREHILACLSSAPSNAKIIRTAATMARAFHCRFTALFVQTPSHERASRSDRDRLRENVALARSLGAEVETSLFSGSASSLNLPSL